MSMRRSSLQPHHQGHVRKVSKPDNEVAHPRNRLLSIFTPMTKIKALGWALVVLAIVAIGLAVGLLPKQEASSEASTPTGNQTSSSKTNPVAKSAADNAFAQGNLATAPTASTSTAPSDYVSSLAYTNTVRSAVSAPALTWSTSLATGAQTYADNCVFAHSGGAYGENIAMGADILAGTKMWGAEKSDWPGGIFTGDTTAGHYTQMIWSNTKQVGCGFSTKCKLLVCRYLPQGNIVGQKP